mgnify:CR=1 FL=1
MLFQIKNNKKTSKIFKLQKSEFNMTKKRPMDWVVLIIACFFGVVVVFDSTGAISSFIGFMDYFKLSMAIILLSIIYFILRLSGWAE